MYLLPRPQEIAKKEGCFAVTTESAIVIADSCPAQSRKHALFLKEEILRDTGLELPVLKGTEIAGGIFLTLHEENSKTWKEEEYTLVIDEQGICITGGGAQGILYGIQTLRQIIRQEGALLSQLEIHDYPAVPARGFYHDVTRGRVPKMEWLKKLADTLSFYKINQLQLYVEHTYLFRDLSEMWRDDTPLSAEDIMELDAYCQERGIDLVPSMSCFGHLYKLLRTKQYRHLGEMPETAADEFSLYGRMAHHTINPVLEESYELITKMIREYMSLFTSEYFNICADETFDLGKGASKEAADRDGLERIYIDYVNKLCRYVISQGKRPMFWGDVICGFPEFIKELPEETICLNWGYAWNQSEDSTRKLAEAGAVQYVCPGVGGWNQFMNLQESAYQNITRMCSYGEKYHAIGVLNTDWGDFGHINHPSLGIPGLIYGAAFSWNREEISFEEINREISMLHYGDTSERFVGIMAELAKMSVFGWWHAVVYKEHGTDNALLKEEKDFTAARENDGKIEELLRELRICGRTVALDSKNELLPVYLSAEAIRIFNKIGLLVSGEKFEPEELKALAQRMEKWFMTYKGLWRTVSRESEMVQVADVIWYYCDLLRDRAAGK